MIIKGNVSDIFVRAVLLLLIASFSSVNKQTLDITLHDGYESFTAFDPGFSDLRNIIDTGGVEKISTFSKLKSLFFSLPQVIGYKLTGLKSDRIKEIDIIIKFSDYEKIFKDRAGAIKRGYLKKPTEVKAEINYEGKKYRAIVRLKGNNDDHWIASTRHSMRVNLKGDETILGFNKFSLHKLRSRQYPYNHAFQDSLRESGNLAAVHNFARISVNGEDWGIMDIEEMISKQFLEREGVKDSLVFRFSNDNRRHLYEKAFIGAYSNYRYSDSKLIATVSEQKRHFKDKLSRSWYTYVLEQRLKEEHSDLYALDPHLRAFFSSLAWNNPHTLFDQNSRYYFNPYNLQLEPITRDQAMFYDISGDLSRALYRIAQTETYRQILVSLGISEDKLEFQDYGKEYAISVETKLNKFNSYFPLDAYKNTSVLSKNIEFIHQNKELLYDLISELELNNISDFSERPSDLQATYFEEHLHVRHYDDGRLLVFNLLPDKVRISRIVFDGNEISLGEIVVPGYESGSYVPYMVKTELKGILDEKIIIHSSYRGNMRSVTAYPTMVSEDIYNPLTASTVSNFTSFITRGKDAWQIMAGEWLVDRPLIIDGDLHISKGTHLKFSSNAYLIVKGELKIYGSHLSPVIFEGAYSDWKGLYVLADEGSTSVITNTMFKNMTGVSDGLLALTGGVNFYKGRVEMKDVSFISSSAEDALNIVNATVSIDRILIQNSASDAFDCDYCSGRITESSFNEVGRNGLDLSGSDIELEKLIFKNVKDKGLSVGESSNARITHSKFKNVGVGIAVKDGSTASVENTEIIDYALYAGMTYAKKKHYDFFSSLNMRDCTIPGNSPFLRQINTLLVVNGMEILERDVDVESLYSTGVMKK